MGILIGALTLLAAMGLFVANVDYRAFKLNGNKWMLYFALCAGIAAIVSLVTSL